MIKGLVMSYRLGGHDRHPAQHLLQPPTEHEAEKHEPEPVEDDPDAEYQLVVEGEPTAFDEADALAALTHSDFYWQLRRDVDRVAAGEIAGGLEVAHPGPKDPPRSRHYKRRDRYGNAF